MKFWIHYSLLIIVIFTFITCTSINGENNLNKINREFTVILFGEEIPVIDMTNGETDLKTRGILGKIQIAFDGFFTVDLQPAWSKKYLTIRNTGEFMININSDINYKYGYKVNGFKLLFNDIQLLKLNSSDIMLYLINAINDMDNLK